MKCTKCGNCITSCPWNIFIQHNEQEYPYTINEDLCVSCGHCMAVCETQAIQHDHFPIGTIHPVDRDMLPTPTQLYELFKCRRSIRGFLDKPVDKELLETIVDASRFAPSTNNIQSNEWLIVQDKVLLETIKKETYSYFKGITGRLNNPLIRLLYVLSRRPETKSTFANLHNLQKIVRKENNNRDFFLHNAPVLLVAHSKKTIGFSDLDAHFALHNATLMIQTLGLGCFFAGYVVVACRKNRYLQRLLPIPADHHIHGCLALGYPKISYQKWIEKLPAHVSWR
jgi:nitroreductase/NAD-dependent dihydropyrimidine dehydrogenase PreA subunit